MSFPFVTRPAAAEEIETAYRWYEKEREGLGSEFLEALEKMVKTIAENPERFPTIRKDIRRAVLLVVTHPFHPLTGQRLPIAVHLTGPTNAPSLEAFLNFRRLELGQLSGCARRCVRAFLRENEFFCSLIQSQARLAPTTTGVLLCRDNSFQ